VNAKDEILRLVGKEKIEAICLGEKGYELEPKPQFFDSKNVEKALSILNFDFDSDYGEENGYALWAWTKSKIIITGTYDGMEWYTVIPRNPENIAGIPERIGGG